MDKLLPSSSKIALITSAINPSASSHKTDPMSRLNQTVASLMRLHEQQVFDRVILIDGSGYDLSSIAVDSSFNKGWLDCYSFQQSNDLVNCHGYGYGELLIYEEFFRLFPTTYSHIYKISGRYIINNLSQIVSLIEHLDNYFFTYYPRYLEYRKYVHTSLFKISTKDMIAATAFAKQFIETHPGTPLERAICEWILSDTRHRRWQGVPLPHYQGVSGYTGLTLSKKSFPYNIFSKLDFLPIMGFSI